MHPGTGVTLPITICGVEAALGGTASASCPQPTTTTTRPLDPLDVRIDLRIGCSHVCAGEPGLDGSDGCPHRGQHGGTGRVDGAGALASTGASLLLEVLIGVGTLLLGLVISRLARRRTGGMA